MSLLKTGYGSFTGPLSSAGRIVAELDIRKLADSYMSSKRVIVAWCLGLTQHENGVDTVREIVNLLLLRGNIGIEGAGPCPILRGHSNVHGNRTCGIDHRPNAAFLDRLAAVYAIEPPREHGMGTVETIRYRGLKGLGTVVYMNDDDMRDRRLDEFDLVDITSYSRDGTQRTVYGYRAIRYEIPGGCTAGYMPELNVLCGIADFSTQSEQPVTKHLVVEITPARSKDR
jgi:anaerobic selenocysteine-containing dehydrogenase